MPEPNLLVRAVAAFAGAALAGLILWDAFQTILVPRRIGRRIRMTSVFYVLSWRLYRGLARSVRQASPRESLLGYYAPLSIIVLLAFWAAGLVLAFALMQFAAGSGPGLGLGRAGMLLYMSGETFFTLGYGDYTANTGPGRLLSVLEAGTGFGFLATVIGYLPTLYTAFSQRETGISRLDARAGSPPTAAEALRRASRSPTTAGMEQQLGEWEGWCAQILETHMSYPLLAYYRSQHANQSWLSSLVCMLDTCALMLAGSGDLPRESVLPAFAMARHALVDLTQSFVRDAPESVAERLSPEELAHLRTRFAGTRWALPETIEFDERLASLRRSYEPYAQALAGHLLIELPPFVHRPSRRDNWQGGPWDVRFGVRNAVEFRNDDHF